MNEGVEQRCLQIFRDIAGLPDLISSWNNDRLLGEPLEAMNIDSLTRLEFIMRVESIYNIELDEAAANACRTLSEFAALVASASKVD